VSARYWQKPTEFPSGLMATHVLPPEQSLVAWQIW